MSPREAIAAEIRRRGPIDVARYMDLALNDPTFGYYATRPSLGAGGDFLTAPHVSQMFGEVIGLWAAQVWTNLGSPSRVALVEIGPGEGVMMGDVLRAARAAPGFFEAIELWLVEPSGPLAERQGRALAGAGRPLRQVRSLAQLPREGPMVILANEVLDCLPIRQALRDEGGWRERRIGLAAGGELRFEAGERVEPAKAPVNAPRGSIFEWSPALAEFGARIGALVAGTGGAALFVDYGRDRPELGDTLQALRAHGRRDPLETPGEDDLTAHVDFPAFLAAAGAAGAAASAVVSQAAFLRALGVELRADRLARAQPDRADLILRQLRRLIAPDQMGLLFKAAAVFAPGLAPPALEAAA